MKRALNPIPLGMSTLTPHLWFNGNCADAIEFYKKAFNATPIGHTVYGPAGKGVMHAMMKIGNSNIMLADTWLGTWEKGPVDSTTAGFFLYVEDCDLAYNQAVLKGCEIIDELMDAFWGDRMGKVKDPYGHCWSIASLKWELTPDEIQQGQDAWANSL